ncbi:hypothetical protein BO94DRAFT_468350 [Aspergillus sclerotioniger CBS 115572]|uniref:F-box domain-containing protein n=1 Tax=Aspergillus sclerotioniger CBS 115572 TaxID=1450535 RepID=A0A317WDW4_9EURO|nr:hypothetical protein BO94DRAFT_468350 [Aspergillus sclerotioniger CBS 115572]PWY84469.1 hypothetical protein BO94DRAFT_468350 [Aspergillus sclerotioniger CBS 115572]
MSLSQSPLDSLPNELLDQIISYLSSSPPSLDKVHRPPCMRLTTSRTRDLKNFSRASFRLLELVRPQLFAHACFNIKDVADFLSFISSLNLGRYVISIVAKGMDSADNREDPFWWRQVLNCLDPLRITVIAPPPFLAAMLDTQIMDGHSWAFEVPFQILQLQRKSRIWVPPLAMTKQSASLLEARAWSSFDFNESSSLRAYNHYEYFLFQVPSIFDKWGTVASTRPSPERLPLSRSFKSLTSVRYTAVFPFYNHVKLVLDAVELMTNLRSFSIQLAPSSNDKTTELEQRGSMDPSDPWMEITTGYSLVAHAVRKMGNMASLVEFHTSDLDFDALRLELSPILRDELDDREWAHDGHCTWIKVSSDDSSLRDDSVTTRENYESLLGCPPIFIIEGCHKQEQVEQTRYRGKRFLDFRIQGSANMPLTSHTELAGPAPPVLAHTLLSHGQLAAANPKAEPNQPHTETRNWNLSDDVGKGFQDSPDAVFRSRTVIGFSKLRDIQKEESDDDEYIGQLPRHLLTTHLHQSHSTNTQTKTYIIHPINFTAFAPKRLLASLLNTSHQPTLSRDEAISCLDSVEIFPVYDFQAVAGAIDMISDSIDTTTPSQISPILIIIAGLDTLAEGIIRASNAVRGAAMLTSVLRTLTQLTRAHASNLSVMLVNTSGLGTMTSQTTAPRRYPGSLTQIAQGDGIYSAFRGETSLFPSLLMRMLDQGVDMHLLLSSVGQVPVVEVIKDRVGGHVGRWCVWEGSR